MVVCVCFLSFIAMLLFEGQNLVKFYPNVTGPHFCPPWSHIKVQPFVGQSHYTCPHPCFMSIGGSRGRFPGVWTPSFRPDACLRLKFLHRQDLISPFNWLIFLVKCLLHFATKLNSRDIQKYYFGGVPSYDLDPPIKNCWIHP